MVSPGCHVIGPPLRSRDLADGIFLTSDQGLLLDRAAPQANLLIVQVKVDVDGWDEELARQRLNTTTFSPSFYFLRPLRGLELGQQAERRSFKLVLVANFVTQGTPHPFTKTSIESCDFFPSASACSHRTAPSPPFVDHFPGSRWLCASSLQPASTPWLFGSDYDLIRPPPRCFWLRLRTHCMSVILAFSFLYPPSPPFSTGISSLDRFLSIFLSSARSPMLSISASGPVPLFI